MKSYTIFIFKDEQAENYSTKLLKTAIGRVLANLSTSKMFLNQYEL